MVKVLLWGSKQNGLCWQVGFEPYLIKEENKYSRFVLDQAAYQQCTHYFSFYSGCVGQKLDKYQILIGSVFMGFSTYRPHFICATSVYPWKDFPWEAHQIFRAVTTRSALEAGGRPTCSWWMPGAAQMPPFSFPERGAQSGACSRNPVVLTDPSQWFLPSSSVY